jgi:membrane protein GlpM
MSYYVASGLTGAVVALTIAALGRSSLAALAALASLFPTFGLFALCTGFLAGGTQQVKLVAAFGLIALLPYATYLVGLLALIDRIGFRLAVALALALWALMAAVAIGLWRILDVESLL